MQQRKIRVTRENSQHICVACIAHSISVISSNDTASPIAHHMRHYYYYSASRLRRSLVSVKRNHSVHFCISYVLTVERTHRTATLRRRSRGNAGSIYAKVSGCWCPCDHSILYGFTHVCSYPLRFCAFCARREHQRVSSITICWCHPSRTNFICKLISGHTAHQGYNVSAVMWSRCKNARKCRSFIHFLSHTCALVVLICSLLPYSVRWNGNPTKPVRLMLAQFTRNFLFSYFPQNYYIAIRRNTYSRILAIHTRMQRRADRRGKMRRVQKANTHMPYRHANAGAWSKWRKKKENQTKTPAQQFRPAEERAIAWAASTQRMEKYSGCWRSGRMNGSTDGRNETKRPLKVRTIIIERKKCWD